MFTQSQLLLFFLSLIFQISHQQQQGQDPVVLHGGSYQMVEDTGACFVSNRFTAACSCPPTFTAFCFDAIIYKNTTVDVSNTVFQSTTQVTNSKFCLCGRKGGLSAAAVFGGGFQYNDPSECRISNVYTSSCSCPSGFQTLRLRSLVFRTGAMIGGAIFLCVKSAALNSVGTIVNDSTGFSLNSMPITLPVLNNFHGAYAISTNQSSLKCLSNNFLPGLRPSRYLTSIQASQCNCPNSACGASFFWITDELPQAPNFVYQRVSICESSMQLPVNSCTEKSKVLLGYQKWQQTPKNGFGLEYQHWTKGVNPTDANFVNKAVFDVWPDTSEYPASNMTTTTLTRPDGSNTTLYDAFLLPSMDLHIKWLQYYGLDGVWLQRFFNTDPRVINADFYSIAQVRILAEKYQRTFGVMWDMSGTVDDNLLDFLQIDLTRLQSVQGGVFNSSAYIKHNGKPLVTLWGLGVRPEVNTTTAIRSIQLLKSYGFAIMGGVPFNWRTQLGSNGQNYSSVYSLFDIITPWTVGVYSNIQVYQSFVPAVQNGDATFLAQQGQGYTPVVYPGFSWTNLQLQDVNSPLNQIARLGGTFWQTQVDTLESSVMKQDSFSHLFLAMYDEFDEGTAITKAAESYLDKPAQGTFLAMDADGFHIPNDHYLCLASRETYRRRQPLSISFPYGFSS